MIPLFEAYPRLAQACPYIPLGNFPTPVHSLPRLGAALGLSQLYIKRDDLSGEVYGGNKVRKLEFILGAALKRQAQDVVTFGYAGSNHALATAIYSQQVGLRAASMLLPQTTAAYVRHNLLRSWLAGATLHQQTTVPRLALATGRHYLERWWRTGRFPFYIPPGGSSSQGLIGFVNAAWELQHQITVGELPRPDVIYVPAGTTGIMTGLLVGLRALGLSTQVVGVQVADGQYASVRVVHHLGRRLNRLLRTYDPSFPDLTATLARQPVDVRPGFFGPGYARYTPEGVAAVRQMAEWEGIQLEGTYTGKTLAALLADARAGRLAGRTVLFWNTYNSRDLTAAVAGVDYRQLPPAFHIYFESADQPLEAQL